ncbi:hypothetical protein P3W85_29815 [Cupriavidus basilensis]|uniref:Uncharacterized protein n=1 Tax=Cupriavidus basilensis TaxID=68895 RepID=A0ABT6AWW3_9BURK|nr:hypothetical protein [Cupriavidus basilensis]MDF3837120.1 hypothetical protein [Cupriavidus basilensis]
MKSAIKSLYVRFILFLIGPALEQLRQRDALALAPGAPPPGVADPVNAIRVREHVRPKRPDPAPPLAGASFFMPDGVTPNLAATTPLIARVYHACFAAVVGPEAMSVSARQGLMHPGTDLSPAACTQRALDIIRTLLVASLQDMPPEARKKISRDIAGHSLLSAGLRPQSTRAHPPAE